MSTKTPEQIAQQVQAENGYNWIAQDPHAAMVAAIEADRAQRQGETVIVHLDENAPAETLRHVADLIEDGMTSGHYPHWTLTTERGEGYE